MQIKILTISYFYIFIRVVVVCCGNVKLYTLLCDFSDPWIIAQDSQNV
jgi:hypothetical protein